MTFMSISVTAVDIVRIDDRVGAMNIQILGTMYVSGDSNPRFGVRKVN